MIEKIQNYQMRKAAALGASGSASTGASCSSASSTVPYSFDEEEGKPSPAKRGKKRQAAGGKTASEKSKQPKSGSKSNQEVKKPADAKSMYCYQDEFGSFVMASRYSCHTLINRT